MRSLIGTVEKSNTFYNFRPLYEVADDRIIEFDEYDCRQFLKGTDGNLNINLFYDISFRKDMDSWFANDMIVIIDLDSRDLMINYTSGGKINLTEYRIDAIKLLDQKRIRHIGDAGIHYLFEESDFEDNIFENEILVFHDKVIDLIFIEEEIEDIYIRSKDKKYLFGPYRLRYREIDNKLYVKTDIKDNGNIVSGYSIQDIGGPKSIFPVYEGYHHSDMIIGRIFRLDKSVMRVQIDLMDDRTLLESLREAALFDFISNGKIDLTDVDAVIKAYESSVLLKMDADENIRNRRLIRLSSMLTRSDELDDTLRFITEEIGIPALVNLIKKYGEENISIDSMSEASDVINTIIKASGNGAYYDNPELSQDNETGLNYENSALIRRLKNEIRALSERIEIYSANDTEQIRKENDRLRKEYELLANEIEEHRRRHGTLAAETERMEMLFTKKLESIGESIYNTAFDGFIADRMLEASALWKNSHRTFSFAGAAKSISDMKSEYMTPSELTDYIVEMIQTERPHYTRNMIINLSVCVIQGFITILSGNPGCGKTSLCNLFGRILGLNKIVLPDAASDGANRIETRRYIPVSVERGWTSKRDFIGYYNPMTKTFDKSNRQIYDALSIMNEEAEAGAAPFPYIILLDEANLSPMEYYWADFMNICDGADETSSVNLGGNTVFRIPETLHFMATINNDHTTETLSPRLLDRSMIITLPPVRSLKNSSKIKDEDIKTVSWKSLKEAFLTENDSFELSDECEGIYEKVREAFDKLQHEISARAEIFIRRYCITAERLFDDEAERSSGIIALDYAIVQKLIPKISGYGDEYKENIISLMNICDENRLYESSAMLEKIVRRGETNMNYYQFFA